MEGRGGHHACTHFVVCAHSEAVPELHRDGLEAVLQLHESHLLHILPLLPLVLVFILILVNVRGVIQKCYIFENELLLLAVINTVTSVSFSLSQRSPVSSDRIMHTEYMLDIMPTASRALEDSP